MDLAQASKLIESIHSEFMNNQPNLTESLQTKYDAICAEIRRFGKVIVAFSGGVDSSLVAYIANQELGEKALAVTSASSSLKRSDLNLTKELAESWSLNHKVIITDELTKSEYKNNPINRCFHCKSSLYTSLESIASELGYDTVLNGTNIDDLGDHRPGLIAAKNFDVRSPLCDAKMTKQDIRDLANYLGMSNANKPQAACLSSRVPYGSAITESILNQIEQAEYILEEYGVQHFRVRHHDDVARLEVAKEEMSTVLKHADEIQERIKQLGYRFVALELGGFKSGSLNQGLIQVVNAE